jgi:hypothetical protein
MALGTYTSIETWSFAISCTEKGRWRIKYWEFFSLFRVLGEKFRILIFSCKEVCLALKRTLEIRTGYMHSSWIEIQSWKWILELQNTRKVNSFWRQSDFGRPLRHKNVTYPLFENKLERPILLTYWFKLLAFMSFYFHDSVLIYWVFTCYSE